MALYAPFRDIELLVKVLIDIQMSGDNRAYCRTWALRTRSAYST